MFFLFKFLQNFYVKTLRTCVPGSGSSAWRAPLRAQVTRWEQIPKVSLVSKLVFFLTVSSQFTTTRTTRVSALRELPMGRSDEKIRIEMTTRADIQIS